MAHFIETDPQTLPENFIRRIREEWALAAATAGGRTNAMTVSWGGIGCLWNQPVAFLFVRPQRYTYQFTEAAEGFALSFFGPGRFRKELSYFGTVSGRDEDKIAATGLTLLHHKGIPCFAEAETVLLCQKLYAQDLREDCALSELVTSQYPEKDYHRMYVGRILTALRREDTL